MQFFLYSSFWKRMVALFCIIQKCLHQEWVDCLDKGDMETKIDMQCYMV